MAKLRDFFFIIRTIALVQYFSISVTLGPDPKEAGKTIHVIAVTVGSDEGGMHQFQQSSPSWAVVFRAFKTWLKQHDFFPQHKKISRPDAV